MSFLKLTLLTLTTGCLILSAALAQTPALQMTGHVVRTDGKSLAFVSIGVPGTSLGTVSDEQGQFTLILKPDTAPTDSVRFSMLGYGPATFTVEELRKYASANRAVRLNEVAQQLAEVKITPTETRTIGTRRTQANMKTNLLINGKPSQNLGSEIGRRFNLPNKRHLITEYKAFVYSNFASTTLRVNIYEARTMKPLLTQNVYVKLDGVHNDWITVDLTPYQIVTKGDVVASVQWVGSEGKGSYLMLPIQMPAVATHLYKYGSQNNWKTFRGMSTAMTLGFSQAKEEAEPQLNSFTAAR
jgi:hypothetical protein